MSAAAELARAERLTYLEDQEKRNLEERAANQAKALEAQESARAERMAHLEGVEAAAAEERAANVKAASAGAESERAARVEAHGTEERKSVLADTVCAEEL